MLSLVPILILFGASVSGQSLDTLSREGKALIAKNALPEAERFYEQASAKARAEGSILWEAEFERAIGETWERRYDYAKARAQYQKAQSHRLALPPGDVDNQKEILRLFAGRALMSYYLHDDPAAVTAARKAIDGYAGIKEYNLQARNLGLLGSIHMRGKEAEAATQALAEALRIYESIQDRAGTVSMLLRLADIWYRRGDFRAALQSCFRAQATLRSLDNARLSSEVAEILGNIHAQMRQEAKALEYQRTALALRQKLGDRRAMASSLTNIGAVLGRLGDHVSALEQTEKALAIRRSLGNPADIALNLNNLGTVLLNLEKPDEARQAFQESLAICEKNHYVRESALPLESLGNLLARDGKWNEAISFHRRALDARRQVSDRVGALVSMTRLAEDLEHTGDRPAALQILEAASASWLELTHQVNDPAQVGTFRQAARSLYPQYARTLVNAGRVEEALRILELSRGIGLARMSHLTTRDFVDLLDEADRKEWLTASANLGRAANRLRALSETASPAEPQSEAEAAYLQADEELARLRERLFATNAALQAAVPTDFSPADWRRSLKSSPDTLVLSWMILDDSATLLFASSAQQGIRVYTLNAGSRVIRSSARRWLDAMGHRPGQRGVAARTSGSQVKESDVAAELYRLLFQPVADQLESGRYRRLQVLPDGPMSGIPFHALLDRRGRRLLETVSISTGVSLRALASPAARSKPALSLFAVGDPLNADETRLVVPLGLRFNALPQAREEARLLQKTFPAARILLGANAREANVKASLAKAGILHFATHGILDPRDGLHAGLLLATEPEGSSEDGILQAWEISNTALAARLAVLSACDTAKGDEQLGEGLIGLAWAFQAAGCTNVIASLWSVDDSASRHLMHSFYKHLQKRTPVEEALRQAMRETAGMAGFSEPYFWAAFQLIGPGGMIL